MSRRHRNAHPCPTAVKVPYPSEQIALAEMDRILTFSGFGRAKLPVRAYLCECKKWHLTSMTKERAIGG